MITVRYAVLSLAILLALPMLAAAQYEAITLSDMQVLADAEDRFAIDSGFYTTLENLDDTANSPGNPTFQYINDGGGALVLRTGVGEPFRRVLTTEWDFGPYVTIQQSRWEAANGDYDQGTPIDLMRVGQPYYFYSPLGLIEPKSGTISQRYYGDAFSRYTIVSHGADGVMSGDDLIYQFGPALTARTISSARMRNATSKSIADYRLVIRGFNLGSAQGTGGLLYDGAPAVGPTVLTWTPNQVIFRLGEEPPANTTISLRLDGGATTRTVVVTNELDPLEVRGWDLYE